MRILKNNWRVVEMKNKTWFLIENLSQQVFVFNTLKELKEFAKSRGLSIKKSPLHWCDDVYYTFG